MANKPGKPVKGRRAADRTKAVKPASKSSNTRSKSKVRSTPLAPEAIQTLRAELDEARQELSRIASKENRAKRDLADRRTESSSAKKNLRDELDALRTELKTAFAEMEIARKEIERAEARIEHANKLEEDARTAARPAEHASDGLGEETHTIKTELERLRAERDNIRTELNRTREQLGSYALRCPKCGSNFVEEDYEGILFDRCSRCNAIYFDAGEVEQLLGKIAEKGSGDEGRPEKTTGCFRGLFAARGNKNPMTRKATNCVSKTHHSIRPNGRPPRSGSPSIRPAARKPPSSPTAR